MNHFSSKAGAFLVGSCLLVWSTAPAAAHGDLHERIEAVTEKIQVAPTDPDLLLQRADLRRQHEEWDAAFADLEKALELRPNWSAAYLQQARIFYDMSKFRKAISAASDCLKFDPANADALVLRARSLVKLEKFSKAIADYDAVLSNANGPSPLPDLYVERARAQAKLERWDDAIKGLDAGMERLGVSPSLALPAIEYERERGALEAALDRLERAKGFMSNDAYLQTRAEIQKRSGQK
jgi:tetratricopeptide (TPR) repeat protein